ncbi:MAG: methyltransferase domain-containing protein [bacterium]|nr:methyltransferase domain-containing protein [bacterium]
MPTSTTWDPAQYHRHSDLRLRPALELFSRISAESPSLVHDIGTGGGEIARLMALRWPEANVIASDSSQEMLDAAQDTTAPETRIRWELLDLNEWQPTPTHDVIYANAVLHWLPDHAEIFPRLVDGLTTGGELAVQMPMSWWQPSHQAIRQTVAAMSTPEADQLAAFMATPNVGQPSQYYKILRPLVSDLDIWTTEYQQVLSGPDPVFDWVSGSILRPVFTQLPAPEVERFSTMCRRALRDAYPPQSDGTTLFPFKRLSIVAHQ